MLHSVTNTHRFFLCLSFLLLALSSLYGEVDTLYVSLNHGCWMLTTYPNGILRIQDGPPICGDTGDGAIPPYSPNDCFKSYLTFDYDHTQYTYIDSVCLRMFTIAVEGNDVCGQPPVWDIANGDRVKLAIDHVDYGEWLDTGDWTAGDVGDWQTISSRFQHIDYDNCSGLDFATYTDVTEAFIENMHLGGDRIQFRLHFDIDTDDDDLYDYASFSIGFDPYLSSYLVVHWSDSVSVEEHDIPPVEHAVLRVSPNPVTQLAQFSIQSESGHCYQFIEIFDVRGRKVNTLKIEANGSVVWNRRDSHGNVAATGVYFCRAIGDGEVSVARKVLIMN